MSTLCHKKWAGTQALTDAECSFSSKPWIFVSINIEKRLLKIFEVNTQQKINLSQSKSDSKETSSQRGQRKHSQTEAVPWIVAVSLPPGATISQSKDQSVPGTVGRIPSRASLVPVYSRRVELVPLPGWSWQKETLQGCVLLQRSKLRQSPEHFSPQISGIVLTALL